MTKEEFIAQIIERVEKDPEFQKARAAAKKVLEQMIAERATETTETN